MDYRTFGRDFCERYYYYYRYSIDALSQWYASNSLITFNGTELIGFYGYAAFFRSWIGMHNNITAVESLTYDIQPIDNNIFILSVQAKLRFERGTYYAYNLFDTFYIQRENNTFHIKNQISRILENRMF